jgi:hypothetical protein
MFYFGPTRRAFRQRAVSITVLHSLYLVIGVAIRIWRSKRRVYVGNIRAFSHERTDRCFEMAMNVVYWQSESRIWIGKMLTSFRRHFTFKHPLFRQERSTSGVRWDNSIYYLWWEFLRRHEGYKVTCENSGKDKYEKLYADFGDVHEVGFREWWTKDDRGARLFAEPPLPNNVVALTPEGVAALPEGWNSGSLLVVAIPLSLRKRFIQQKLSKLLARHHKRKRGQRTFKESRALYPIAAQFNVHSLKKMLELYDFQQSQPEMPLWEIGQRFNLGEALTKDELKGGRGRDNPVAVAKKNVSAVAASKKLRQVKNISEGVGDGVFPAFRR